MDITETCTHHSTARLTSCDVLLSLRHGFGASLSGVHACLYLFWDIILSHSSGVIHSSMYETACQAVHGACCPQQADAFCMAGTPQICPALPNNHLQDLGPLVANSDHNRTQVGKACCLSQRSKPSCRLHACALRGVFIFDFDSWRNNADIKGGEAEICVTTADQITIFLRHDGFRC